MLNQRKNSEDDFADKVAAEKGQKDGDETESVKSVHSQNEEKTSNSNNLFAGMMNVDNVLADKAKKKEEKKRKMEEMHEKKSRMRPFVLFTSVKDNPIPYEKKYMQNQAKLKKK